MIQFWPLLKVLQFLGACPIKKDGDSPCGFKAFTFWSYLLIVLFVWVLGFSIILGAYGYLSYVYDVSVTELSSFLLNFAELSEMDSSLMFALSDEEP